MSEDRIKELIEEFKQLDDDDVEGMRRVATELGEGSAARGVAMLGAAKMREGDTEEITYLDKSAKVAHSMAEALMSLDGPVDPDDLERTLLFHPTLVGIWASMAVMDTPDVPPEIQGAVVNARMDGFFAGVIATRTRRGDGPNMVIALLKLINKAQQQKKDRS